jgi:hypothetical protein
VLQIEQTARQLRLEVLGGDVKALRVQVYDLSGRSLYDQRSDTGHLIIPLESWGARRLADGGYLYSVEIITKGEKASRAVVHKLLVMSVIRVTDRESPSLVQ